LLSSFFSADQAARYGITAAKGNLAVVYLHGHGVAADVDLAAAWYNESLEVPHYTPVASPVNTGLGSPEYKSDL